MSEIINNKQHKIETMKGLIKRLHSGEEEESITKQLGEILEKVDYSDVFAMENQLIAEGIPAENIRKLCDVHTKVLRKHLDLQLPLEAIAGHPVHTFLKENKAVKAVTQEVRKVINFLADAAPDQRPGAYMQIHRHFNELMDLEKHYQRKENLVFPYFEKKGLPGPSTVMWGKDDEVRELLKAVLEVLPDINTLDGSEFTFFVDTALEPALAAIDEMIYKEDKVFLPMAKDLLTEQEWYEVYLQSDEIGFCLYVPEHAWQPQGGIHEEINEISQIPGKVKLPTGMFEVKELIHVLNALPFDLTFVDREDTVRFFSEGKDRIFTRTKAILGRKVQFCHPPDSVHIVEQILSDFKSCKQDQARFWINFKGRFIYIAYYAVRDEQNEYLGTLEVTQDLTELRALEGEQRLLTYDK